MDVASVVAVLGSMRKGITPSTNVKETPLLLLENIANPLSWSLIINPDVRYLTHRIRKHVLGKDPIEAWKLKESYKDTFALEAVSAAIIAQIAITLPNLANFGDIHWTATAFAYTSLVNGLLSTYYSFYVQQTLGDLHSHEDVHDWLTSPRTKASIRFQKTSIGKYLSQQAASNATNDSPRVPSITAGTILTAPSRLLSLSIVCLFVAIGIYLGSIYTAKLGSLSGSNGNLAVLLFFIIFSTVAIMEVSLPLISKDIDEITTSLLSNEENAGPTPTVASGAGQTGRRIREALEASILAHEGSIKAQKALLELLNSQPHLESEVVTRKVSV